MKYNYQKYLSLFFQIISLHSLVVGLGLIFLPFSILELLGFNGQSQRFFPAQGGVFHIIMAIGYTMASINMKSKETLIIFSMIVKFSATIFLFIFYLFVEQMLMVLLSLITDLFMGLIILFFYNQLNKREFFRQT